MEQTSFEIKLSPVEAVIEAHAEAWRANTKIMVAEAVEHINSSCGQRLRYVRERHARETFEFWESRRPIQVRLNEMTRKLLDQVSFAKAGALIELPKNAGDVIYIRKPVKYKPWRK